MQSKFSLTSGRFLLHDENLVLTIQDTRYARPLLAKLESIEAEEGTDMVLKIMCHLAANAKFSSVMRMPSPADHASTRSLGVSSVDKYGKKHTCPKCAQKFFDLNGKIQKCPTCHTNIATDL
jgi:hypothetical protein